MNDDNRDSYRHRTLKGAKVILGARSVFDCTVRNLSKGGALIRFSEPIELPERFDLLLSQENRIVPCVKRWQKALDCGIEFSGPSRPANRRG